LKVTTRFGLNEKLIVITISTIFLVLSSYVYFSLKTFIHIYKESIIKMVFAQAQELKNMVYDVTKLGLALGELKGMNEECGKMVRDIPYATYCFIMDNTGRVYYHNLPEKTGSVYTDSITQNAIKTKEDLVQDIHLDSRENIYDFSLPLKDISGAKIGTIRIGTLSNIIDDAVRNQRERALLLGALSILVSFLIVSILYRLSILKSIRSLMSGITGFGEGKFDTRVALETKDEFGELAKTFNRMADELQKTTASLMKEIAERKNAQDALKESENYLKTIFDFMQTGVMIVDAETHRIVDVNPVVVRLFGAPREEIVGNLCHKFICPAEEGKCPITDLHQEVDNTERLLIRSNGEKLPVLKSVIPITLRNHKYLLESLLDISEHRKAEEERERLIKELEEGRRAIKNVAEDLRESKDILEYQKKSLEDTNKELDDFTYIVSHDLKEPLRSIDAYSKFIVDDYQDKLGEEGRHYLERIRANAERMKSLIEDLLEISRLKKKGSTIEGVETEELIGEVKMRLEYAIKQKGVEIIIKDKLPKIFCDRVRLAEVFLNLISNAIKFNDKPKPIIEIGYNDKGDFHEFYVKDNGIGIEEEYFDKIFEIFQRLGKKEDAEGTGAGLTIVKKIIQLHKGKIWLESKIGEGCTFYFTIPKEKSMILGKRLLGEILIEKKLVTEEDIKKALEEQERKGEENGRIT